MLSHARGRLPDIEFVEADAQDIPFGGADDETAAVLPGPAGFAVEEQPVIDCHWILDRPGDLAETFEIGAPRGSCLLSR